MSFIAVVNVSTVVSDTDLARWVHAVQAQLEYEFAPNYGGNVVLQAFPKGHTPGAGDWLMLVADDSTQAGALGYHETGTKGIPDGYVFAKSDLAFGLSPSVTLSHEVLEMAADPYINTCSFDTRGDLRAYEACDAVEADSKEAIAPTT